MVIRKRSRDSSDKENWEIIFRSLVKTHQKKEDELQSVIKRWKLLEDRFTTQHDYWVSDVYYYEKKLSLMKKEIETMKMMWFVEIAKFNLLLGLKERDRFSCGEKLEYTQAELDEFRVWFDIFNLNRNKGICDSGDADDCESLEAKIRKLKLEFEKVAFGKRCDVSTLLRDTGFAWSQFKRIESGFTDKLMRKDEEIKLANKKISSLQEQLQSSNHEKDKIVSRLMAKVAELEDNASKDNEISRPSQEVKPLRRSLRRSCRLNRC